MFGSDDKKSPPAEKKGLFGWFRKKTAEPVATPAEAPAAAPEAEERLPEPLTSEPVQHPEPVPEPPEAIPSLTPVAEEEAPSPVALTALVEPLVADPILPPVEVEPVVVPETEPEPVSAPVAPLAPVVPAPVVEPEPAPAPVVPVAPVRPEPEVVAPEPEPAPPAVAAAPAEPTKLGFFARLRQGLSKTSASLGEGMASLFLGKKAIDDDLLEELETRLLTADVGVEATGVIMRNLTQKVARKQLADSEALYQALQQELTEMLLPVEQPLVIDTSHKPYVILVVGVNGAGKTTTIGKLAKRLQNDGKKVMLAAGDTFRAAAVEQLQVWGERNRIPVIAQHTGADSASVIFDAVQAAKARGIDVLIADTAGRLHTKDNLMEELRKVRRVIGKLDEAAPHETLLVLDAGTGQNALNQAKQFHNAVPLTGLALTKLDGTAKGGVIFALAKQSALPIRYVGVGEGIDDLRPFEARPFVQALFAERGVS
ncbi:MULTISPECIES: signal recognition particle-docking protein FtsY [Pseudomonas]|uniref:signal recognition particle-docking protein FtsY n=1 Tax=Pseudomonas TaxID=286 RepID=UPI00135E3674|nr:MULTISPECIES: signal recognition particle-docking protein FtsY [Pseudomonas]MXS21082.1 signal recognition particle-docking protein FtsY [Pseudomonas oryzihabitans]NRH44287.1 signal recognition particle-docking protein FtsY [Pseudomonas sp. MS15a(2019)]